MMDRNICLPGIDRKVQSAEIKWQELLLKPHIFSESATDSPLFRLFRYSQVIKDPAESDTGAIMLTKENYSLKNYSEKVFKMAF